MNLRNHYISLSLAYPPYSPSIEMFHGGGGGGGARSGGGGRSFSGFSGAKGIISSHRDQDFDAMGRFHPSSYYRRPAIDNAIVFRNNAAASFYNDNSVNNNDYANGDDETPIIINVPWIEDTGLSRPLCFCMDTDLPPPKTCLSNGECGRCYPVARCGQCSSYTSCR